MNHFEKSEIISYFERKGFNYSSKIFSEEKGTKGLISSLEFEKWLKFSMSSQRAYIVFHEIHSYITKFQIA